MNELLEHLCYFVFDNDEYLNDYFQYTQDINYLNQLLKASFDDFDNINISYLYNYLCKYNEDDQFCEYVINEILKNIMENYNEHHIYIEDEGISILEFIEICCDDYNLNKLVTDYVKLYYSNNFTSDDGLSELFQYNFTI